MKVELSKQADSDLTEICKYSYRRFAEVLADQYDRSLWDCFNLLASNPRAGRERTEFQPPARCHHHQRHLVFYDVFDDHILIVRVLHGRMDIERHL